MARPPFLRFLTTNQQQVEAQVLLETRFFQIIYSHIISSKPKKSNYDASLFFLPL